MSGMKDRQLWDEGLYKALVSFGGAVSPAQAVRVVHVWRNKLSWCPVVLFHYPVGVSEKSARRCKVSLERLVKAGDVVKLKAGRNTSYIAKVHMPRPANVE
jgi:hypothetical protein